jgi:formylglycine-generating enzyme required for sulfatase activity
MSSPTLNPSRIVLALAIGAAAALAAQALGACSAGTDPDAGAPTIRVVAQCEGFLPQVHVPGGVFLFGTTASDPDALDYEYPPALVGISRDLCVLETEVTQRAWNELVGSNPSHFKACGLDCPVESVSMFDAMYFANVLSERDGLEPCYDLSQCRGSVHGTCEAGESNCRSNLFCIAPLVAPPRCDGYRLPTSAEWEYLGRPWDGPFGIRDTGMPPDDPPVAWNAQTSTAEYEGGDLCDRGAAGFVPCGPQPVAQLRPNGWGLYDMSGSVWEWTSSLTSLQPYPRGFLVDYPGDEVFTRDVEIRGGSWSDPARDTRVVHRGAHPPLTVGSGTGFRLVRNTGASPLSFECMDETGTRRSSAVPWPDGTCIEPLAAESCPLEPPPFDPVASAWTHSEWGRVRIPNAPEEIGETTPDGEAAETGPAATTACNHNDPDGLLVSGPCDDNAPVLCVTSRWRP